MCPALLPQVPRAHTQERDGPQCSEAEGDTQPSDGTIHSACR